MSIPINRRTLLATAAATILATAIAPLAAVRADSLARVDVYDRSAGEALPVYRQHGRRYVEGRPGNEYAVRIRNCTDQRLLAVLSVDGVNAVTGETASPDQAGYVIEPGGYVTVQGWRKDLNRTAAFYFSDPEASYAARTGRPNDLGVIGVALFRERPVERQGWFSSDRRTGPAPSRGKAAGRCRGEGGRQPRCQCQRCRAGDAGTVTRHRARTRRILARAAGRIRACQHTARRTGRDALRATRNPGRDGRPARGAPCLAQSRSVPGRAEFRP